MKSKNPIKKEHLYDMNSPAKKRVAIYARVSTLEKGQDPETQLLQLREFAQRRGFEVTGEYVDYASGKTEYREQYKTMLDLVRKRQIEVVLVWRYDRFARSTQALVNALNEFKSLGVDFISYQENVDTTTPQGELIFSIMASLAQFESALISERVKAGMARAKAQGKRISRPRLNGNLRDKIKELYDKKTSIKKITKQLGISYGSA
ncbi:MAG: recombinase family protein [Bacteroidetes bacterium]|nr:recombinase family protein [Bacteroidota bacterium]